MKRAFQNRILGSAVLNNAFIKTATFEGMYDKGIPNQNLIDHHVSMATELREWGRSRQKYPK